VKCRHLYYSAMLGPLLSHLSISEKESYLSNEEKIKDAEQALLSSSEVKKELEEKLEEARLRVLEQTKTLHALYAWRQDSYYKVFQYLQLTAPNPNNLFHRMKKEDLIKTCNLGNKTWGSRDFYRAIAQSFPVYEETDRGTIRTIREIELRDAVDYWQQNISKIVID